MKTIAIIQARMGSIRLPGKMMILLAGRPIIFHVVNRVKKSKLVDQAVLATSDEKNNEVLIEEVKKYGIDSFVGDENDVLDRFYQCAKKFNADIIVRITGDCPLIDPKIIDKVIEIFQNNQVDYASNVHPPTFPDGFDVEVFSFGVLEKAWQKAKLKSEREHVTPYIWKNKEFIKKNLKNDKDFSHLRLTIDEKEDLDFLNLLFEKLNTDNYEMSDVIQIIKENPELININSKFIRNQGYTKSIIEDKELK
jgi:spore coat polysaccharide biosynthesis protein SpsF (cytidylyltransferase family)